MRTTSSIGSQAGFTTIEAVVAVGLLSMVMVVVLTAFDTNASVSRVQQDISDLQQNARIAPREVSERIRMAGRGGLPRALALAVTQDVDAGTTIGTDNVVEDTDILTLRGTFAAPIYRVDSSDRSTYVDNGAGTATLVIDSITSSGFDQPLDALQELEQGGSVDPEPIVIMSGQSTTVYSVVELAGITFQNVFLPGGEGVRATLTLNTSSGQGVHTGSYLALGSVDPSAITSVLFASVLEEYRYFAREDFSIPGDVTSPPNPRFSVARMVPGTDTVHPSAGSLDIADNIFDFQLALGIDLDGNGMIDDEDGDGNPLPASADEWLWNDAADDLGLTWATSNLSLVRLSLLGRTPRPDLRYVDDAIASIENRDYSEPAVVTGAALEERRHRRRLVQSVVDLRNL